MDPMGFPWMSLKKRMNDEWRIGSGFVGVDIRQICQCILHIARLDPPQNHWSCCDETMGNMGNPGRANRPTKTSRSRPACAFKFRPIGYDFYDVKFFKHPIFGGFMVFLFLHVPTRFEIARFGGFQLPSTAESVMSHDGPYSKHPNCRPKTLRWLAGTSTPGETHCDFNAPFFVRRAERAWLFGQPLQLKK